MYDDIISLHGVLRVNAMSLLKFRYAAGRVGGPVEEASIENDEFRRVRGARIDFFE